MSFNENGIKIIRGLLEEGPKLLSQLGSALESADRPQCGLKKALLEHGLSVRGEGGETYASLNKIKETQLQEDINWRNGVLKAFTMPLEEGKLISLCFSPKPQYIKYNSGSPLPPNSIPINPEYRVSISGYLDKITKKEVSSSILKWCCDNKVNPEHLMWKNNNNSNDISSESLINSFYEAQPYDIRDRVVLPRAILKLILGINKNRW